MKKRTTLYIRFWTVDRDTGKKKDSSRWYEYDSEKDEIEKWFDEVNPFSWCEETKYVKRKELF